MLTVALTIGDTPTTFVKGLPHNILIKCHVCHVLLCPVCNIKPGIVMHLIIFKNPCGHGATTSEGLCHFHFNILKAVKALLAVSLS